uniref:Methyltransferase FkbM domain-containing protein n=1 Tax=Eutreptiella gymnastica TaxID=73025 RepID=A0A7S1JDH6_9EUGL|mmetsp:Transcript_86633/g.150835  ORF Transcript_86633/g.150835 Transcript_86633/m.150835 type:complete len:369 (+) Transcript_86633:33-1139(+)
MKGVRPSSGRPVLRVLLQYGGAFILGLLCMHTMSRLFNSDAVPAQTPNLPEHQPSKMVEPKQAATLEEHVKPQPPVNPPVPTTIEAPSVESTTPIVPASGQPTYCDLINTVNELGRSVSDKKLTVSDLLHVLSQSIKPFTFVQIGAHVGGVNASHDDTMPLTKQYGWHGLLVEPNPFLFKELVRKYKDWPNLYFAQVGIGATDGNMTFYAVTDELDPETGKSLTGGRDRQWFVTQLSTFDPAIAAKRMRSVKMLPIPVEVNTFPTLVNKPSHTIKMPHYVLIDTEGYDWKVLSTIDMQKYRPYLLIYEHNKLGANKKTASDFTAKAGYRSAYQDHQNTVAWRTCSPEEAAAMPGNTLAGALIARIKQG